MRTPPKAPPEVKRREDAGHKTEVRRYKVITPLFGGGVEPATADPVTTVRVTEIRGQLRFWWRAYYGGSIATLEALQNRENAVWGSTREESRVKVSVLNPKVGGMEAAFKVERVNNKPKVMPSQHIAPYAAFPLLPDKDEQHQIGWQSEQVLLDVTFSLALSYPPELAGEIESTLWAWETFGGIGARTRRGFGALQCLDEKPYPSDLREVKRLIAKRLPLESSRSPELEELPILTSKLRFRVVGLDDRPTEAFNDPISAWKDLIGGLNAFRQARYGGKYGLSKWPEANEIRRLHGLQPKLPQGQPSSRLVRSFPRAAFGLPIVFHMPHDRAIEHDLTLEGAPVTAPKRQYDRLASRLILRPLVCEGGRAVGLAAILDGPVQPPLGLRLKDAPNDPQVSMALNSTDASQIEPLSGSADVLQAFLDWL